MNTPLMDPVSLRSLISSLIGMSVEAIEEIGSGRNSKVYRLDCEDRSVYAAKLYFHGTSASLNRLEVELSSLEILWKFGIRCIPRPIAADISNNIGVYDYIEGSEVHSTDVTRADIDELIRFLLELKSLSSLRKDLCFPNASGASFSTQALIQDVRTRLNALIEVKDDRPTTRALRQFLKEQFIPTLDTLADRTFYRMGDAGFASELPRALRTLSPADFGFHNARRRHNGELVFLDFEYFGWEDPVKMIADFLLHPAQSLSENLKKFFAQTFLRFFDDRNLLKARLDLVYPLFALRWCLILLNEFNPLHINRRLFAAKQEQDIDCLQLEQLAKAKELFHGTVEAYTTFPHAMGAEDE